MSFDGSARMCLSALAVIVIGVWFLSLAAPLHAQESTRIAELRWDVGLAGDGCPDADAIRLEVTARLGRRAFDVVSSPDVVVDGRIERTKAGTGYAATIHLRGPDGTLRGTRELYELGPCSALREPVALVIALMIDPDAGRHRPSQAASSAPTKGAPSAPLPSVTPALRKAAPRGPFMLGLAGSIGLGLTSDPAPGARGTFWFRPDSQPAWFIAGSYWFSRQAPASPGAARGYMSMAVASVGFCPLHGRGAVLSGGLCAVGQLGAVSVEGSGFDLPAVSKTLVYAGLAAEAYGTLRLVGPLSALVGAGFIVPLERPSITYGRPDGTRGLLFEGSRVAVSFDLGLAVAIP